MDEKVEVEQVDQLPLRNDLHSIGPVEATGPFAFSWPLQVSRVIASSSCCVADESLAGCISSSCVCGGASASHNGLAVDRPLRPASREV